MQDALQSGRQDVMIKHFHGSKPMGRRNPNRNNAYLELQLMRNSESEKIAIQM